MAADCEIGGDGVVLCRTATHLGPGTYPGHVAITRGATATSGERPAVPGRQRRDGV